MGQLQQEVTTNPSLTLWDLIKGDPAGTITVLLLVVAYVLYALAIIVFCFFYALFGAVLYVSGLWCWRSFQCPGSASWGRCMPST